jgi:hypothetical protein
MFDRNLSVTPFVSSFFINLIWLSANSRVVFDCANHGVPTIYESFIVSLTITLMFYLIPLTMIGNNSSYFLIPFTLLPLTCFNLIFLHKQFLSIRLEFNMLKSETVLINAFFMTLSLPIFTLIVFSIFFFLTSPTVLSV